MYSAASSFSLDSKTGAILFVPFGSWQHNSKENCSSWGPFSKEDFKKSTNAQNTGDQDITESVFAVDELQNKVKDSFFYIQSEYRHQ